MPADAATRAEIFQAIALGRTYGRMAESVVALDALSRRHPEDIHLARELGAMARDAGDVARGHAIHAALLARAPDEPAVRSAYASSATSLAIRRGDAALFAAARRILFPRRADIDVRLATAPLPLRFVGVEVAPAAIGLLVSDALTGSGADLPAIAARILRYLPFWFLAVEVAPQPFAAIVDFGDGDDGQSGPPRLAFSSGRADIGLIPDCDFVGSGGYRRALQTLADPPWVGRKPIALWRGASSGTIGPGETVEDLPRMRLVRLSREPAMAGRLDAGFHMVADPDRLDDAARAAVEALVRPYVPAARFGEWRYQVDVDGYANAWSGFFTRLATGSPVLKVASRGGYRQWFYDRLRAGTNMVPVAADLSDLADRLDHLRRNDGAAQAIGAAGRALALSLDWRTEMRAGIETAIAHAAGRRTIAV